MNDDTVNNELDNNTTETLSDEINHDFDQAAQDLGLDKDLNQPEQATPEPEIPIEAQVAIGKQMIGGGLLVGFNSFGGLNVEKDACHQFAEDLSACICKWYPGGILAFMDKYKEELAVIYSGSMLFIAVKAALKEKAANDEQDDDQQQNNEGLEQDVA